ncbi:hypothetical protein HK098_000013 [Nowakowskiella sp. JEL0407]|nr:hypothetical protein HK098_000013 [Nowakowskiella sp. JEL0407]
MIDRVIILLLIFRNLKVCNSIPFADASDDIVNGTLSNFNTTSPNGVPEIPEEFTPSHIFEAIRNLQISSSIVSIILMVKGLFFCLMGQRLMRPTLFLTGAYIGVIGSFLCLNAIQNKTGSFGSNTDWIYFGVCIGIAIIIGLIFCKLVLLGCIALGGLLGYCAANLALVAGLGAVMDSKATIIFVVVLVVVGAVSVFFMEKYVIIFGTAIAGAFSFVVGLDTFLGTGFNELFRMVMNAQMPELKSIPEKVWIMCGGILFLTLIGITVQLNPPQCGSAFSRENCCGCCYVARDRYKPKRPRGEFIDKDSNSTLV